LAAGADRLVARGVLEGDREVEDCHQLVACVPLAPDEYL
jgi:hypothetical protein